MRSIPAEYSLREIPELEESDFEFSFSTQPRFEDANDFGDMCDSVSFSMDSDGFHAFDD